MRVDRPHLSFLDVILMLCLALGIDCLQRFQLFQLLIRLRVQVICFIVYNVLWYNHRVSSVTLDIAYHNNNNDNRNTQLCV